MNTFKRLGVSAVLLLMIGCTAMPTYDSNGNYRGSVLAWDVNAIANAGTGAMAGALIGGVLFGDPLGGAALGAGVGVTSSYGYGYYPQQQYYPPQQYYPQQRICNTVDVGGWYTQFGQYIPNYQVVCR